MTYNKSHVAYIVLLCSIVAIPMVAFTASLIGVIFVNVIDDTSCPYPELCPGPGLRNATSRQFYYINFPAARLALVSSFSSSISLSLIGALMAMYGYVEARRIVNSSRSRRGTEQHPHLNPYQFSILIRVLNADLLSLWELGFRKVKSVFRRKNRSGIEKVGDGSRNGLRISIGVFVLCILACVLIHAADTYFHIAAESLNLVQIHPISAFDHRYSRGLAPWCLNRDSTASSNNRHFWSCGLQYDEAGNMILLSNTTEVSAVMLGKSTQSKIYHYTDSDNVDYSIIGPYGVDTRTDWTGSTYGVSTQCSAIPADACTIKPFNGSGFPVLPFECPKDVTGFEIAGNITQQRSFGHYFDWHRYLSETDYFDSTSIPELSETKANATYELAKTLTDEDDNKTFTNPWHWISVAPLYADLGDRNPSICTDRRTWKFLPVGCGALMVFCNTTVWDITYGVINQEAVWINKTKSNGTVSGIASMANLPAYRLVFSESERLANIEADSIESYLRHYQSESSRYIVSPLATQTSPRAALRAQRRDSDVVTKLPTSALWVLIAANLLFMGLGFVLAVLAIISSSEEIHQVSSHLGVAGLVAQLFGNQESERGVRSNSDLFRAMSMDSGDLKGRVDIGVTMDGSVHFELVK